MFHSLRVAHEDVSPAHDDHHHKHEGKKGKKGKNQKQGPKEGTPAAYEQTVEDVNVSGLVLLISRFLKVAPADSGVTDTAVTELAAAAEEESHKKKDKGRKQKSSEFKEEAPAEGEAVRDVLVSFTCLLRSKMRESIRSVIARDATRIVAIPSPPHRTLRCRHMLRSRLPRSRSV